MLLDQNDGAGQLSADDLVLEEISEGLELFGPWRRHVIGAGHFGADRAAGRQRGGQGEAPGRSGNDRMQPATHDRGSIGCKNCGFSSCGVGKSPTIKSQKWPWRES